jgi:phenylpropionate dioxygenase-like ring-hydroxylating dioxygenase large terminal subunit
MGLSEVLQALSAAAAGGGTPARSLPPSAYTDPDVLALERERIFRREWICLGRVDEIPRANDYFTTRIGDTPVLVTRAGTAVRAYANVCRHRGCVVASGRGNAAHHVCPYHAWSYSADGRLASAPRMPQGIDCGADATGLPALATELWNGFVYVNLDANAAPLAPRLAGLSAMLARYHLERMRTVVHYEETWDTNWKCLTENFMEAYHVGPVHPETLVPFAPLANIEILPGTADYNFYRHKQSGAYEVRPLPADIEIPNPDLTEHERAYAYIGCVFPSHAFSVAWDWVFWLSLQPAGVGRVRIECGVGGPVALPDGCAEHPAFPYPALVAAVNAEDRPRVEAVQRGLASGYAARGPLHPHEAPLVDFMRFLARCLVAAPDAGS